MNCINISGRLVYEPEIKTTNNGASVISTRIAANRNDKNKTADFFNVKIWNKTAEFVAKYFKKGDPIELTGKLQTESYEKQDGTKVNDVYIFVTEVNFCLKTTGTDSAQTRQDAPGTTSAPRTSNDADYSGAGLPFEI